MRFGGYFRLNYIAHTKAPLKCSERAETHRADKPSRCDAKQQAFLDFVLAQHVAEEEQELGLDKLRDLLKLTYGSPIDAVRELGSVKEIKDTFRGFQSELYKS